MAKGDKDNNSSMSSGKEKESRSGRKQTRSEKGLNLDEENKKRKINRDR